MAMDSFIPWAMDPRRTVEERYTVELLVESALIAWNVRHKTGRWENWEVKAERDRQRLLNPAYQPKYSQEDLERAWEVLPEMKEWSEHGTNRRPVRDLQALLFLPALEKLGLASCEVTDLTPLVRLPNLRELSLHSRTCEDFRLLAGCSNLRSLSLSFGVHWPEVSGLENLRALESLSLGGNLLVFPKGTHWPSVKRGSLLCAPLPARTVAELPQFPQCEFLTLSGVERLDGVERFPLLRNLTVNAPIKDLEPLTALERLTCLTLQSDQTRDVRPLARIPGLQVLTIENEKPRDYSPLAEAPALRELHVKGCPPVEMEVAAINAGLPSWEDVLLAPEPRPLPPLRMIIGPHGAHPRRPMPHRDPSEPELIDPGLRACEAHWVGDFVERSITEALGHSDWGQASANGDARAVWVEIHSFDVVEKLPEILDAARAAIARLRYEYEAGFMISLRLPPPPATPAQEALLEQFHEEQDEAEYEQWKRDQEEYLERLHRYELKRQEGGPIKPEEFAAPAPKPPPPAPWEVEDEEEEDDFDDYRDGAATAEAIEPPPDPFDDEHPLADNYNLMGHLSLGDVWFLSHQRGLAVHLMGREPDEELPSHEDAE